MEEKENEINTNIKEVQDKNEIIPQNKSEIPQNEIKENQPQQPQQNVFKFPKPNERRKTKVIYRIIFNIILFF